MVKMTMNAIMLQEIHMLGTSMKLYKGEVVDLLPATNLPQGGYFATPKYDNRFGENSFHLDLSGEGTDYAIIENPRWVEAVHPILGVYMKAWVLSQDGGNYRVSFDSDAPYCRVPIKDVRPIGGIQQ